ncbi:hypothetical protein A2U01_0106044 [Trifolium medium]|uniref:Uncharacterized protein n=1 Tax=Trifolium medium TaxID=97028 RepID=A0A392V8Y4_9FABA|nr:hypothetical protein [Trifolium medium]
MSEYKRWRRVFEGLEGLGVILLVKRVEEDDDFVREGS